MEGRRRKRFPSKEEMELWAHVTCNDEPVARQRTFNSYKSPPPARSSTPEVAAAATLNGVKAPEQPALTKHKPLSLPPSSPFDPRMSKKISRGRLEIDARLDLHGLRQQDAYIVLRRFLTRCQAEGLRHVLIITGKGGASEDGADGDFWKSEERGVLRRLVPHWLSEPSFRLQVVSFTESALKHGGSGALYVTIRKGPRHVRHSK